MHQHLLKRCATLAETTRRRIAAADKSVTEMGDAVVLSFDAVHRSTAFLKRIDGVLGEINRRALISTRAEE